MKTAIAAGKMLSRFQPRGGFLMGTQRWSIHCMDCRGLSGQKKWEKIYQGLNIQEYQGINHLLRIYLWDIPYMFFQSASGCLDLKMRLRLDMRCMRNWPSHKDFPARCLGPSRSLGEGRGDFFFSNPWSGGVKLAKQRHGQCIWNYRVLFI